MLTTHGILPWLTGFLSCILLAACSGGGSSSGSPASQAAVCTGSTVTAMSAGTNPGGVALGTPRFAYVSNDDNTVSMYTFNAATGGLRANGYVLTGHSPWKVVVDPSNQFLYVPNTADNTISAFRIGASDGTLTEIAGSPFPAGTEPGPATIDPAGRFLFVGNTGGNSVTVYRISPGTGALSSLTGGGTFATGVLPFDLVADPSGQFLYVTNASSNSLSAFRIDGLTGSLTPLAGSPYATCQAPTSVTTDPRGRVVYVANTQSSSVSVFVIEPVTGILTANGVFTLPSLPPRGIGVPSSVAVDGQTLYVLDANNSVRWDCPIDQTTGAVSCRSGRGFYGFAPGYETTPIQLVANTFVVNHGSNTVANIEGAGLAVATRTNPISMAITRGTSAVEYVPRFLYAVNNRGGSPTTISAYSVAPDSGTLTAVTGAPFATGTSMPLGSMAVHPTGRFIYATSSSDSRIYGFGVDVNGILASVSGSPYIRTGGLGANLPEPAVIEPSGRFLYAFNSGSGTLSGYAIAQATGSLTQLGGSPFSLPPGIASHKVSIETDSTGRFLFLTTPGTGGNLATLAIDPVSGAVSIAGGAGPARGAGLVVAKSDGRCLYAVNPSLITHYTLDPFSGVATEQVFSQLPIQDPVSVASDPFGRFFIVTMGLTIPQSTVWRVSLFQAENGCAFSTIPEARALAAPPGFSVVDPSGQFLYVAQPDAIGGAGSLSLFGPGAQLSFGPTIAATGQAFTGPIAVTGIIR